MKQLLLRVDDELHARLTAQARARGTSVNALANEILGLGIDPSALSRTDRLRLKLMAIGELGRNRTPRARTVEPSQTVMTPTERDAAIETTRGWGAIADELIDDQRGPR